MTSPDKENNQNYNLDKAGAMQHKDATSGTRDLGLGVGAPDDDLITFRRSDLTAAIQAEILDYFPGFGGDPKLTVSEARLIATQGIERAVVRSFGSK
jgi:hypothetical protein